MAKNIVELTARVNADGTVGGRLHLNDGAGEKEKMAALHAVVAGVVALCDAWDLHERFREIVRVIDRQGLEALAQYMR